MAKTNNIQIVVKALDEIIHNVSDLRPYTEAIQADLIADVTQHFEREKGPSGKWKKTSDATLINRKLKRSKGKKLKKVPTPDRSASTLSDFGTLKNSLIATGRATGSIRIKSKKKVGIGTSIPYASINNFGGTISRPAISKKSGKFRFPNSSGSAFVFASSVKAATIKIPKREFMWVTKLATTNINKILMTKIEKDWANG